ncbi:MAG: hypothetical protein K6F33_14520 [Bacteroidales bacterium]|nr:hypothetical protein [Bacteroidales bacterium]
MKLTKFPLYAVFLVLGLCMGACGDDDDDANVDNGGTTEDVKEEEPTEEVKATELQTALKGTYVELFSADGLLADKWLSYWEECCMPHVNNDEDAAKKAAAMLQNSMVGTVYGADAVAKYSAEGASLQFDCFFINGVSKISIDGRNIKGVDADGKEVFSHNYTYVGDVTDETFHMTFAKYKSDDDNADEFTYFFFAGDTPATTYHIEFRYGSSEEELLKMLDGKYAYWLAAGTYENASDDMIKDCIKLFVDENLGGKE